MYQYQLCDRNDQFIIAIGFCVVFVQCPVVFCCSSSSSCVLLVLLPLREELNRLETRGAAVFFSLVVSRLRRSSLSPTQLLWLLSAEGDWHHPDRAEVLSSATVRGSSFMLMTEPPLPISLSGSASLCGAAPHHRYEDHTGNQRLLQKNPVSCRF